MLDILLYPFDGYNLEVEILLESEKISQIKCKVKMHNSKFFFRVYRQFNTSWCNYSSVAKTQEEVGNTCNALIT